MIHREIDASHHLPRAMSGRTWWCVQAGHVMEPATPDLRYAETFVPDAAATFERAARELQWTDRMSARRTASAGRSYDYSGQVYPDVPMPAFVRALADRVAAAVDHPITNCLANFYPDGASRMGFHFDAYTQLAAGSHIAVVSLGARRTITFRTRDAAKRTHTLTLEDGSLLVMAPSVQDGWMHALLPSPGAGARISLTFRQVVRAAVPPSDG